MSLQSQIRLSNIQTEKAALEKLGFSTVSNLIASADRTGKWAAFLNIAATNGDDGIDAADVEAGRAQLDALYEQLYIAVGVFDNIKAMRDDETKIQDILDRLGMTYEEISAEFD